MNLLAIGDSIMWGQGNTNDTKFVALVTKWLNDRGTPAQLTSLAHSGAIAAPTARDGQQAFWGEVPEAAPSVLAQLAGATINPADVDIVLVNGGINDVSAFHIVAANPFEDALPRLTQRTDDVFAGPVAHLVESVVSRFQKAKVIVLGYYPIVSALSRGRDLVSLMKMCCPPLGIPNTVDWVAEHLADDVIDAAIVVEKARMVQQCAAFYARSSQALAAIVARLADQSPRVALALPAFKPENAFAAPSSWLWAGSDDPLHQARLDRFTEQLRLDPFLWPPYTPLASICHPNEAGAAEYARAITDALQTLGL